MTVSTSVRVIDSSICLVDVTTSVRPLWSQDFTRSLTGGHAKSGDVGNGLRIIAGQLVDERDHVIDLGLVEPRDNLCTGALRPELRAELRPALAAPPRAELVELLVDRGRLQRVDRDPAIERIGLRDREDSPRRQLGCDRDGVAEEILTRPRPLWIAGTLWLRSVTSEPPPIVAT